MEELVGARLIGGVMINLRKSLREPGEVDILVRGDRVGDTTMFGEGFWAFGDADDPSLVIGPSFVCSVDVVRLTFLNGFHEDFRDLDGLVGVPASSSGVSVPLRFIYALNGSDGEISTSGSD